MPFNLPKAHQLADRLGIERDSFLEGHLDETFLKPIKSFLSKPGKGVRAQLVEFGAFIGDRNHDADTLIVELGQIIEVLHAGSLIVDDIQDGSTVRRGQQSLHLKTGLSQALNCGNWMYFWALDRIQNLPLPDEKKMQLLALYSETLFEGHIGQALDLGAAIQSVSRSQITQLCLTTMTLKTGSLTKLAICSGAIATAQDDRDLPKLKKIGESIGVLLQILNDLKNLKRSAEDVFADIAQKKPCFFWVIAADHCSDQEFSDLLKTLSETPDPKKIEDWMNQVKFFDRAQGSIEDRKSHLVELIKEYSSTSAHFEHSLKFLYTNLKILENDYEQT